MLQKKINASALAERITFKEGNFNSLSFADNSFDWVWSADCVGYPAGDWPTVLKEIVRVTRPGGRIALLAWTSQQVLSGYPLLEARLNAMASAYTPLLQGQPADSHFMRALPHFAEAGITEATARTFIGEVQAPLSGEIRSALGSLLGMLWDVTSPTLAEADRQEYQQLCRAASPGFILERSGYYAFFTYTVFSGRIAT